MSRRPAQVEPNHRRLFAAPAGAEQLDAEQLGAEQLDAEQLDAEQPCTKQPCTLVASPSQHAAAMACFCIYGNLESTLISLPP